MSIVNSKMDMAVLRMVYEEPKSSKTIGDTTVLRFRDNKCKPTDYVKNISYVIKDSKDYHMVYNNLYTDEVINNRYYLVADTTGHVELVDTNELKVIQQFDGVNHIVYKNKHCNKFFLIKEHEVVYYDAYENKEIANIKMDMIDDEFLMDMGNGLIGLKHLRDSKFAYYSIAEKRIVSKKETVIERVTPEHGEQNIYILSNVDDDEYTIYDADNSKILLEGKSDGALITGMSCKTDKDMLIVLENLIEIKHKDKTQFYEKIQAYSVDKDAIVFEKVYNGQYNISIDVIKGKVYLKLFKSVVILDSNNDYKVVATLENANDEYNVYRSYRGNYCDASIIDRDTTYGITSTLSGYEIKPWCKVPKTLDNDRIIIGDEVLNVDEYIERLGIKEISVVETKVVDVDGNCMDKYSLCFDVTTFSGRTGTLSADYETLYIDSLNEYGDNLLNNKDFEAIRDKYLA